MITFQNKGLIDLRGITTFGVCAKETENPIGFFGTGLKYALAVILREGLTVTLYHGTTKCTFRSKKQVIRSTDFHIVQMNKKDLSFTTELGKNWELWMAYRELASNAFDEEDNVVTSDPPDIKEGYTTFVVEGSMIDKIHEERDQIFLTTTPRYTFDSVELHDGPDVGRYIFYRGIRVYELPKTAMYNYNLLHKEKLTEDRTLTSIYRAYLAIAKAILTCDNAGLIRQILEAHQSYFESRIDYNWGTITPGETFNKIVERYGYARTSYNTTAGDVYKRHRPEKPAPASIQLELIPIKQRQKLRAALMFWDKLGIHIPRDMVRITDALDKASGTTHNRRIYLSQFVLEMEMRQIAGYIYKHYSATKPKVKNFDEMDFLIDTVVDFGERILGIQAPKKQANG